LCGHLSRSQKRGLNVNYAHWAANGNGKCNQVNTCKQTNPNVRLNVWISFPLAGFQVTIIDRTRGALENAKMI
jgi:hypothetical protein